MGEMGAHLASDVQWVFQWYMLYGSLCGTCRRQAEIGLL